MSTKTKSSHNLKRQGDPLGNFKKLSSPPSIITPYFFTHFCLDEILKKNLYLSKYAKSHDQPHLGNTIELSS
jgi:hypothetical protein